MDAYHADQKAANMETSVVAALLFQSCRASADFGRGEKAQLTCLAEKLCYSKQTGTFVKSVCKTGFCNKICC